MARLKYHCEVVNGYAFKSELFSDEGIPLVRQSNLKSGSIILDGICYPSEITPSRFLLREGDICIGLSGSIENFGVVRPEQIPAAVNQRVAALRARPKKTSKEFVLFFVQSSQYKNYFIEYLPSTTIANIDAPMVGNVPFPDHDLTTQKSIADFLNCETARIDQLIGKKQRLVELLAEKQRVEVDIILLGEQVNGIRTEINGRNFTSSFPIKWEMRKLKSLCSHLGNGFVGPTRDILVDNDSPLAIPYLQSTHIKNRRIDFDRRPYFVTETWLRSKPKAQVKKDDLLIVQTGDCGATAIVDERFDGAGCHAMIITRPVQTRISPRLLLHILCSAYGRAKFAEIQTGALHPHLEVGFVKDLILPVPPRDQHETIVAYIEQKVSQIEGCAVKTSLSINRLREFRAALITAAVTGQIDVTVWGKRGETDRRVDQIEERMRA